MKYCSVFWGLLYFFLKMDMVRKYPGVMSDITHPQALFGSAIYDSPVYSEEEIFGSPQVFKTTVG